MFFLSVLFSYFFLNSVIIFIYFKVLFGNRILYLVFFLGVRRVRFGLELGFEEMV